MTYREFMQELPNDITPEAANEEYRMYQASWCAGAGLMPCHRRQRVDPESELRRAGQDAGAGQRRRGSAGLGLAGQAPGSACTTQAGC